tara:strand:+ start:2504 stop:3157 length:654 start_codon:yes stop_codon:yes gene_type:complete
MKLYLSLIVFFIFLANHSFSQIETRPLEKKIEIDKNSKSILKLPENNLPDYLKKDFFSKNPALERSKGFENNIQMENEEAFINPGDAYLKKLNSNKSEGSAPKFKADQYLGDFISSTENVRIVFRDHQEPDGDRVQIRFNDDIIYPNILLTQRYKKMDVKLMDGFNKIDFVALNQGESGPNTAEVRVYDDDGNVMMSNLWNLATGSKATFIVVKQED